MQSSLRQKGECNNGNDCVVLGKVDRSLWIEFDTFYVDQIIEAEHRDGKAVRKKKTSNQKT